MPKKAVFLSLFLVIPFAIFAQIADEKYKIIILDFVKSYNTDFVDTTNITSDIHDSVNKEVAGCARFLVLDSTVSAKTTEGATIGGMDNSDNSKIVENGRRYGARYILTGFVTLFKTLKNLPQAGGPVVTRVNSRTGAYSTTQINPGTDQVSYTVNISFSLKLIDLSSGQSTFGETINISETSYNTREALRLDYKTIGCRIKFAITKMFPAEIHIIKLDEVRNGKAKMLTIDKGKDLFFDLARKSPCAGYDKPFEEHTWGEMIAIQDHNARGLTLLVVLIDSITVNGVGYAPEKQIGKLEIEKIDDHTSICEVETGEREILENFNLGKQLKVKIL